MLGGLLLVIGIVGVAWGVVEMYDDRDSIDINRDIEIIVDDGDFPRYGVASAIIGGVGLIFIVVGSLGRRREHANR
jgi:hypothetical protein